MLNIKTIFEIFTLFVLIFVLLFLRNLNVKDNRPVLGKQLRVHEVKFFDKNTFYDGVSQAKKKEIPNYRIYGGIIPHHLFPGFIIADFFNRLSLQNPKTVILIGPNHEEKGDFNVLTSLYSWSTPFGVVDPNEQIIQDLIKTKIARVNEDVLLNDHAVAGSIPFLKYYLPNATVVPVLLSSKMDRQDTEVLAEKLKIFLEKEDIVLIAAVDFSHYLNNKEAQEKDKITEQILRTYDYRQLFTLNNDYVDSPPSIATLMLIMQKLGKTNMEILFHTNSGEMQHNDSIETTSYFEVAYH